MNQSTLESLTIHYKDSFNLNKKSSTLNHCRHNDTSAWHTRRMSTGSGHNQQTPKLHGPRFCSLAGLILPPSLYHPSLTVLCCLSSSSIGCKFGNTIYEHFARTSALRQLGPITTVECVNSGEWTCQCSFFGHCTVIITLYYLQRCANSSIIKSES